MVSTFGSFFIVLSMASFVALGFNLEVYIHPTGGEAAAGLGMDSSGRQARPSGHSPRRAEQRASCETARPAHRAGKPQKNEQTLRHNLHLRKKSRYFSRI
ncbi:hypothetical protein SapgrDRAFT_1126 [Saprospira grandis DSM 2844]|uniref:Uncharacterized protein n=1 Tax=Saprospira grandis DSM 2844 TaxID=694433 RepID=J0XV47_9BACT|nr:hypothetical protein SapgrDRAFT_1126 [Saprospira grandis DSM 2844]